MNTYFLGPIPYVWNQKFEKAKVLTLDRWMVPSVYFWKENLEYGFYYWLKDAQAFVDITESAYSYIFKI